VTHDPRFFRLIGLLLLPADLSSWFMTGSFVADQTLRFTRFGQFGTTSTSRASRRPDLDRGRRALALNSVIKLLSTSRFSRCWAWSHSVDDFIPARKPLIGYSRD